MSPRTSLTAAERRAASRLRQLLMEPGVLHGNLVETRKRCGKRSCRCATDEAARHHAMILCLTLDGKRTSVLIPGDWEARVREWVARYGEMRELLEQLSRASLQRLKGRAE